MIIDEKKKKKYIKTTYTTGDIQKNIDHFNKMLSGKVVNTHTDGLPNTGLQKAAEETAKNVGTFASQSPDGAATIQSSSGDSGVCESLNEAKRYVRRYYIRPQHIFCSNKSDIIKALIDIGDQNCSVYTLNNLIDNDDITKLTNKDIIYYYDDGILYDKNHVRVMDYDLYVKHEEKRDKIDANKVSDSKFKDVYDDRITDKTIEECVNESNDWVDRLNNEEKRRKILNSADSKLIRRNIISNNNIDSTDQDAWVKRLNNYEDRKKTLSSIEDDLFSNVDEALNLDFCDVNLFGERLVEGKEVNSVCCICGEDIDGYGNNPEPYMSAENGERCCDACNLHFVIPARLEQVRLSREDLK